MLAREPAPAASPRWVSGAWWRTRLVLDGRVVRHPGPALWLQDGDCYVDLRGPGPSPLDGPRVFAGTTSWSAPHLRWHHVSDSAFGDHADIGRLARRGDETLVETGVVRTGLGSVSYRERWERVATSSAVTIEQRGTAFVVRTDRPLLLELRIGGRGRPPTSSDLSPHARSHNPIPRAAKEQP